MSTGAIVIMLGLLLLAYIVYLYNRLISLKNRFLNAFSQIDVQLQRRHELVPNLVTVAKTYLDHEHDTLVKVTEARNVAEEKRRLAAADPGEAARVGALARAESELVGQLGRFQLVVEEYPELKADDALRDLHEALDGTENRIAFARQAYSDEVMRYNTVCEQFPAVLVARLFAFEKADLFEVSTSEMRSAVRVSFA